MINNEVEQAALQLIEPLMAISIRGSTMLANCAEVSAEVDRLQGMLDALQAECFQFLCRSSTTGPYRSVEEIEAALWKEIVPAVEAAKRLRRHLDEQHELRSR